VVRRLNLLFRDCASEISVRRVAPGLMLPKNISVMQKNCGVMAWYDTSACWRRGAWNVLCDPCVQYVGAIKWRHGQARMHTMTL
jgi:hypothetical protein